ncbi:MAG: GGDEF domain-containing protein, partial [Gammaproteobacteria bacterium]
QAALADEKTGLLRATAWQQLAGRELAKADRSGTPLAVLMVDLDHFKRVNDTHGHLAGDEVLRAVAAVLRTTTRRYDVVGRFGGEEFVLLLPETSAGEAEQVAQRISDSIRRLAVTAHTEHGATTIEGLTVSIGAAIYPHDGLQLEELLLAADVLLMTAKHGGRDQIKLARANRSVR